MVGCSPFSCGSWPGRTGWVQHPTGHLIPGWTEGNKPSGGEARGKAPPYPLPPPAVGWVLRCHPWSKQTQQYGLIKRCLWSEGGDIREDFKVVFPPPCSLHHAHLSFLSQNWKITTQSQQASHTLRSIRNNENRFLLGCRNQLISVISVVNKTIISLECTTLWFKRKEAKETTHAQMCSCRLSSEVPVIVALI